VPKRDRPAAHVYLGGVEAELAGDGQGLGGKRFVELEQVDVIRTKRRAVSNS